jgi:hypothetical protein
MGGKKGKWYPHIENTKENRITKLVTKYKPCGRHGFGWPKNRWRNQQEM